MTLCGSKADNPFVAGVSTVSGELVVKGFVRLPSLDQYDKKVGGKGKIYTTKEMR